MGCELVSDEYWTTGQLVLNRMRSLVVAPSLDALVPPSTVVVPDTDTLAPLAHVVAVPPSLDALDALVPPSDLMWSSDHLLHPLYSYSQEKVYPL